jgi:ribosomal protein L40E
MIVKGELLGGGSQWAIGGGKERVMGVNVTEVHTVHMYHMYEIYICMKIANRNPPKAVKKKRGGRKVVKKE